MRFDIARFCLSRKIVWSCCRFVWGMGYVIMGLVLGIGVDLIIMLLRASCSWTG